MFLAILTSTMLVRIANKRFRTETSRLSVRITDSSRATGVGLARVPLLYTSSDSVRTLEVAGQTGTLGKPIAEDGTLGVGSTRRWLTRVLGHRTRLSWWVSFKFGQAETLRLSLNHPTPRIGATWIGRAFIPFWDCNNKNWLYKTVKFCKSVKLKK